MTRKFLQLLTTAVLFLFAATACTPARKQLLGDPENPYPLSSPPHIGEVVHLPTGTIVTREQMIAVAGDARVVYIGESHDNPAAHRLELQVLQGLAEIHPGRQALGMEMFTRSQQPVLDRWVAGKLDEKEFLKESHWYETWKMDFDYYRDLLNYAREHKIPVVALNAEKSLVEAMRMKAPDQMTPEQRAQLPALDLTDPYQRGMVKGIFGGHSHGKMVLDSFLRVQTLWDETMAESVAGYLASRSGRDKHLLVVAGGNHVSYGFGIPRRAFRRLPVSYLLIGGSEINIPPDKQDRLMDVDLPKYPMVAYDFQVFIAYEDLVKRGVTLGVMFEPRADGHGVTVKGVLPGSNAEHAGLRPWDVIVAMDGKALTDSLDLMYAVKKKQPGDYGKLKIEREGKPREVNVLFKAEVSATPEKAEKK